MITRAIIFVMFMLLNEFTSGQFFVKAPLLAEEVEALKKSLNEKMSDTARMDVLLKLAKHNLDKINIRAEEISDLDSAETYISIAKEVNSRQRSRKYDGRICLYESTFYRKGGNSAAAIKLANKAITELRASKDELYLARAYLELSCCYDSYDPQQTVAIKNVFDKLFLRVPKEITYAEINDFMFELRSFYVLKMNRSNVSIKLDYLYRIVRCYQMVNDKEHEFWARKEIADIEFHQGKTAKAIDDLLQIAKEQKEGSYLRICWTYDLLSGLYGAVGNYEKAIYYALESIKNVNNKYDSSGLNAFYARVAYYYTATGSAADAVLWNFKRLEHLIAEKKSGSAYGTIYLIVSDLVILGREQEALKLIIDKSKTIVPDGDGQKVGMLLSFAKSYAAVKNYSAAERYCEEAIKLDEEMRKRKQTGTATLYNFLALFYLDIGQYNKAEKYKKLDYTVSSASSNSDFYFKLDSARGNYLSAIRHLQAGKIVRDSIFTAAKSKQIEELKIAYATDQKDSLIKFKEQNIQLLTKQDELQKSKLQQGAILRNISFGVATLLIIIIVLLYNRYRLKQRTNRRLELQQSEIAKQNLSLNHLVNEKDWLVKEIHHRVKNNLQIVMSLLNSQSVYIDNEPALTAIHDSQHRVHAMSLIHQKLYNSENLSSIDMSFYIRELVTYLSDSFDTGQRIRFELKVESLNLDVSQAVPLGLILNEAITNSIKYAFPNDSEGVINISLSNTSGNQYLLDISDNGIGIPSHLKNKKAGSLGMSLMAGLSEDLDGNFSIENNNGTVIKILFVHDLTSKRPDIPTSSFVNSN